jgi:hypothetical protein
MTTSGDVTNVTIDGTALAVPQTVYTKVVTPLITTTYTGYVAGRGGNSQCTATVTVAAPIPPPNRVLGLRLVNAGTDGDSIITVNKNGYWTFVQAGTWQSLLNTGYWEVRTATQIYQIPVNVAPGANGGGQLPGDWSGVNWIELHVDNIIYQNSSRNPTGISYNNLSYSSTVNVTDGCCNRPGWIRLYLSASLGL